MYTIAVPRARRSRSTAWSRSASSRPETGRRFVEHEQARVHRQAPGQSPRTAAARSTAAARWSVAAIARADPRELPARVSVPYARRSSSRSGPPRCGSRPRKMLPATSSVSIDLQFLMDDGDAETGGVARDRQHGHGYAVDADVTGVGRWTPARIFISVDLPAPFSPTSATISPARHVEVHPIERDDAGKALRDCRHLQ